MYDRFFFEVDKCKEYRIPKNPDEKDKEALTF